MCFYDRECWFFAMNELDCLKNYVDIVRYQGLSHANRYTGVPISILSKQLSWLEEYYGVRLIERSNRRFVVTDIGMLCYKRAKQILDYINDTEASLADLSNELIGEVKISYPGAFFQKQCAACMVNLNLQFPKLHLQMSYDDYPYSVMDGETDIAISNFEVSANDLERTVLLELPQSFYVSSHFSEKQKLPKTVESLSEYNCLFNHTYYKGHYWETSDDGKVFISGNFISNDDTALVSACLEGVGVLCYPDYLMKTYLNQGKVLKLTLDNTPKNMSIYLYHAASVERASIKTAIEFIQNYFKRF